MPAGIRCDRVVLTAVVAVLVGSLLLVAIPGAAPAAETPRKGGVLLAVIGADPPSLDPHQESTFANIQLVAPLYSLLLQIDPYNYPKIIGDVATDWKISPDGLTYTFKLRPGIRFHDGSPLTSADVKATYDKIVFPPQGVHSIRKEAYTAVDADRGARSRHRGLQAQVPVGLAPGQPGLAVERHLPEEVPRQGPELLQDQRGRLRPLQVQELHARLDLRGRAQPRLLHQGPAVPRRLQVLHQPGDLRAGGGHPVRARLHRVPRPAQRRGRGHQEAARRQGRRPADADGRPVRRPHQQHGEAVHRPARAQGGHPRLRPLHGAARCSTRSPASGTPAA